MDQNINVLIENIDDVCEIYTRLTSLLLEYGYKYIQEHKEVADDIHGIKEVLNALDAMDSLIKSNPGPGSHLLRIATSQPTIISDEEILKRQRQPTPEKLSDVYKTLASNLHRNFQSESAVNDYLEESRFTPPRDLPSRHTMPARPHPPAHVLKPVSQKPKNDVNPRKQITNLRLQRVLENRIKQKLDEKLGEMQTCQRQTRTPVKPKRDQPNPNQSINVEHLNLEI